MSFGKCDREKYWATRGHKILVGFKKHRGLPHFTVQGAIHTSELDRSEIDLSPKRSECERSNAN